MIADRFFGKADLHTLSICSSGFFPARARSAFRFVETSTQGISDSVHSTVASSHFLSTFFLVVFVEYVFLSWRFFSPPLLLLKYLVLFPPLPLVFFLSFFSAVRSLAAASTSFSHPREFLFFFFSALRSHGRAIGLASQSLRISDLPSIEVIDCGEVQR